MGVGREQTDHKSEKAQRKPALWGTSCFPLGSFCPNSALSFFSLGAQVCLGNFLGSSLFFFLGPPLPPAAFGTLYLSTVTGLSRHTVLPVGIYIYIYSWEGKLVQMRLSLTQMFAPLAEEGSTDFMGVTGPSLSVCLLSPLPLPSVCLVPGHTPKGIAPVAGPFTNLPSPGGCPDPAPWYFSVLSLSFARAFAEGILGKKKLSLSQERRKGKM